MKHDRRFSLFGLRLLCAAALLMGGCPWATLGVSAEDDLSVEQASAALKIAFSTAQAMRQDVIAGREPAVDQRPSAAAADVLRLQKISADAVARALQFGPPTRSEAEADDPLIFRSVVVDINQNIPKSTVETFRRGLSRRLLSLSDLWRLGEIEPQLAYDAFRVCVNPPSRPDRLFLYATESSNSRLPSFSEPESAAHELVRWAAKANRIGDLEKWLNEQQLDAVAEGCFLFLLLAIEKQDEDAIGKRCQQLQAFVQRAGDPSLLRLLATCLMKAELSIRQLPEASLLLQKTGETLLAVDGQSVAQANFAATAAVDGFRTVVSQFLRTEQVKQRPERLAELANRLLMGHRLPEPLSSEFGAAIADELLMAGLAELEFVEPVKSLVAERQLRLLKHGRVLHQESAEDRELLAANGLVKVNWNPGAAPDLNSIWVQLSSIDDVGDDRSAVTFTLSGLISVGSPSSNLDGSMIAFHGRTPGSAMGSGNHVYVVDRNRKTITDIGPAVNPSLTATGRRLTCSRYTPDKGVWVVRSDGSNWKLLDEGGWASKFSPDGTQIGYTVTSKGQTGILVYDLVSDGLRPANGRDFPRPAGRDQGVALTGWPFCWAKSRGVVGSNCFWWLNREERQLVKYPVHHFMMDKYLSIKRVGDVKNVAQDLNCLADDQLIWLGPMSANQTEMAFWKQGDDEPEQLVGRRLLGMTVFGEDQVVLLSGAGLVNGSR